MLPSTLLTMTGFGELLSGTLAVALLPPCSPFLRHRRHHIHLPSCASLRMCSDTLLVFQGEATIDSDRKSLVLPLLGMYAELYSCKDCDAKELAAAKLVLNVITEHRDYIFPKLWLPHEVGAKPLELFNERLFTLIEKQIDEDPKMRTQLRGSLMRLGEKAAEASAMAATPTKWQAKARRFRASSSSLTSKNSGSLGSSNSLNPRSRDDASNSSDKKISEWARAVMSATATLNTSCASSAPEGSQSPSQPSATLPALRDCSPCASSTGTSFTQDGIERPPPIRVELEDIEVLGDM